MATFIHTSLLPVCEEIWSKYDIKSGWGFDKILCQLTNTDAAVIHQSSAFAEMDTLLYEVFPRYMRSKGIEDWKYIESQIEKEIVMII